MEGGNNGILNLSSDENNAILAVMFLISNLNKTNRALTDRICILEKSYCDRPYKIKPLGYFTRRCKRNGKLNDYIRADLLPISTVHTIERPNAKIIHTRIFK
jgi:hypothetical protein